jgi:phage portal protein BeeE
LAGQNVTERTAMQNTAVYAFVRVLPEGLAELPLHVYEYTSDGDKQRAIKHSLYFLHHDAPNSEMTSFIFRETLVNHLCCGVMPTHKIFVTAKVRSPGSTL